MTAQPTIDGLIIDSFAGGGGASTGIEAALGRPVDIAINHDEAAIAMHRANHPATRHYCRNVWQADPSEVVKEAGGPGSPAFAGAGGPGHARPVALAWFSPDCKHFSKAKGGRPVKRSIRDLAWIVVLWAKRVRPRVIMLENVEEFRDWGPLIETEDGRYVPCSARKGQTFARWTGELRRLGYRVEWKELRACDYGAPTIRRRLFLVARCDGEPIRWPEPTHGDPRAEGFAESGLKPWRTAAECIDWSIPCPSIFERKRPLAEATMARIARGIKRFVIDAEEPFIVNLTHHGGDRVESLDDPFKTITAASRGEKALIVPHLTKFRGGATGSPMDEPVHTVTANSYIKRPGGAAPIGVVAAFMAQHNTGMTGHRPEKPLSTIVQKGCTQAVVASHLVKLRGTCRDGQPLTVPMPTVTSGGTHVGEVRAFLMKYYSTGGQHAPVDEPMHTLTAKARMGLVTIAGADWRIVDIGMRMLTPRELFNAQGFPGDFIIDPPFNGKPMTKTKQVEKCGNSVCPDVAAALVRANMLDAASSGRAVA